MFSQAERTVKIVTPDFFVKLCRESNHFPCFDRRKLLLFVFETALSSYTMPGIFLFELQQKTFHFPQARSEINQGAKIFQKTKFTVKMTKPLNPLRCNGLSGFLPAARGAVLSLKLIKIVKRNQTRNPCVTRLSQIGRKLLSGNFGSQTGKM